MLMIAPLAFRRAGVAHAGTELERFPKHLLVRARPPDGELSDRFANVSAVEARADALAHVHFLGRAGVRAAETHPGAVHEVVRRIAERLVDVPVHVRVKGDHLADGHWPTPEILVENQPRLAWFLLSQKGNHSRSSCSVPVGVTE